MHAYRSIAQQFSADIACHDEGVSLVMRQGSEICDPRQAAWQRERIIILRTPNLPSTSLQYVQCTASGDYPTYLRLLHARIHSMCCRAIQSRHRPGMGTGDKVQYMRVGKGERCWGFQKIL